MDGQRESKAIRYRSSQASRPLTFAFIAQSMEDLNRLRWRLKRGPATTDE